jgi:hypothetical protein
MLYQVFVEVLIYFYYSENLSVFRNSDIENFTVTIAKNPSNIQIIYFLCRLWRLLLLDKSIGDKILEETPDPENNPIENPVINWLCNNPNSMKVEQRNFSIEILLLFREFQRKNLEPGLWCSLKPDEIEKLKKVFSYFFVMIFIFLGLCLAIKKE